MYLIISLRKTEEKNNMKIIPMASDDNDKIHHIMTVKEAKTKYNEGICFKNCYSCWLMILPNNFIC